MIFSDDFIQKVKVSNDIVDVISESVNLKKRGKNYFGLCPFHNEKTPSFSVSKEKQIYKCFGCGEAGNVISFVMKTKNLPFVETINLLADRANIEIEPENTSSKCKSKNNIKLKLYNINVEAARYFYINLRKNENAKQYFLKRGLSDLTIKRFGLGYSIDSWDNLLRHLKNKGYTELDLLSLGLIIKRKDNNGYYDRFRNRVIFPIFDYRGKVIGFGGRVLDDSNPKYLNTPETILFNKGSNLYGLNFALKNNTKRTFIIVEGYMDCISLHQAGIKNTVASLGTALTSNQANLLKRYVDKVIIAYDGDTAGQKATLKGLDILKKEGLDVKVVKFPKNQDPDEFLKMNGKNAFLKLVDDALSLIDYKLECAAQGINFDNSDDLIKYFNDVTDIISKLDPIQKNIYIKKISRLTGIKEQVMYDQIGARMRQNTNNSQDMNIVGKFGQKLYLEPSYIKAERWLLKFMTNDKETYDIIVSSINKEELILDKHKQIYEIIVQNIDFNDIDSIKNIELKCDLTGLTKEWTTIYSLELPNNNTNNNININEIIDDYIIDIRIYKLEKSKEDIIKKINELEKKGLIEESIAYAKQLIEIQKEISGL